VKERYQGIDDKSEDLRDYLSTYREKGQEFLQRYEMSWIYHDSALEGVVYSPPELNAALRGDITKEREKTGYRKDMPLHRTYFHEIAQPLKIPALLEKLVDYTAGAEFRELHPIEQAATVQHQFLHIFPFAEHSGKVGRMCSNLVLLRHHYLPCVIHSIDRQRYYEALRASAVAFRLLLVEAMENSLDNALKYFRDQARRYRAIN